jgi:hypothetical protein
MYQVTFYGSFYPRGSAVPREVVADIRTVETREDARLLANAMNWTIGHALRMEGGAPVEDVSADWKAS